MPLTTLWSQRTVAGRSTIGYCQAERVRDMLIITVENNTLPGTRPAEGTTKKDRFVHGFGIPNIKKAVEKYDGQCSFHQGDGTYLLKILIPIP